MQLLNKIGIYLQNYNIGTYKTFCPKCKNIRKPQNKHDTPLSVTIQSDKCLYKCHNCDWTGIVSEEKYHRSNKDFKLVAEKMKLVMKDMNVRPEVEDRLSDLLTIIMWEDELKPLILKKEWEVKQ